MAASKRQGAIMSRIAWKRALIGGAAIAVVAAIFSQAAVSGASRVTRYLIVSGDESSGSWDSRDEGRFKELRASYGSHFAWLQRDGHEYVISGDATLADLQRAMAPQLR